MSADNDERNPKLRVKKKATETRKWANPVEEGRGGADWGDVDPTHVLAVISALAKTGGAVRFGYTRDGGAFAVGIYGDGEPFTVYAKPHGEIEDLLQRLWETYQ